MGHKINQIFSGTSSRISQTVDLPILKLNDNYACDSPVAKYLNVTASLNAGDNGSRNRLFFLSSAGPTNLSKSSKVEGSILKKFKCIEWSFSLISCTKLSKWPCCSLYFHNSLTQEDRFLLPFSNKFNAINLFR